MVTGDRNGMIVRAGLSLAAVLSLSGAAVAGQAGGAGGAGHAPVFGDALVLVDDVVAQTTFDLNPGDEAIAVGEPDPTAGSGDESAAGDGAGDQATDDGSGDGTDVSGAGSGDGTDVTDAGGDATGTGDGIDVIYTLDGGPNCGGCEYQDEVPVFQVQPGGIAHNAPAQVVIQGDHEVEGQPVARGSTACAAQHPSLPWLCEWQNGIGQ